MSWIRRMANSRSWHLFGLVERDNMQEQKSPWCCSLFRDLVISSEDQGSSIKIVDAPGYGSGLAFFLEYRAARQGAQIKVTAAPDVKIVWELWQGIRFCPWCGENLREHYARTDDLPIIPSLPWIDDE